MTGIGLLTGMVALAASACDSPELRDELDDLGRGDGAGLDGCSVELPVLMTARRLDGSNEAFQHDEGFEVTGAPADVDPDRWAMTNDGDVSRLYHMNMDTTKLYGFTKNGSSYDFDEGVYTIGDIHPEVDTSSFAIAQHPGSSVVDLFFLMKDKSAIVHYDRGETNDHFSLWWGDHETADHYEIKGHENADWTGWGILDGGPTGEKGGNEMYLYAWKKEGGQCNRVLEWEVDVADDNTTHLTGKEYAVQGFPVGGCRDFGVMHDGGSHTHFFLRGGGDSNDFLLQTGTALHETGDNWEFELADNLDLYAIKKSGTGSGKTEVHVLSASSGYQEFSLQTGTVLPETGDNWEFELAPNRDLYAIKKSSTGSNSTEVHRLSASSGYEEFSLQTGTALHEAGDDFEFELADNLDLYAIKKSGTGSGSTEIHRLSASSDYQEFSLQTGTALGELDDDRFALELGPNDDLYAIKKSGTGTDTTEVHRLSASSGYKDFSLQTGTPLHETGDDWELEVAPDGNIYAIKKSGTGSGSTEIHAFKP